MPVPTPPMTVYDSRDSTVATPVHTEHERPARCSSSFYKNGRIRKGRFRRARSMEPSGAAHQPRALGTANPARILACLSLLRQLRARARPSRPTTFSDNMCALDDDARMIVQSLGITVLVVAIMLHTRRTPYHVQSAPSKCFHATEATWRPQASHKL